MYSTKKVDATKQAADYQDVVEDEKQLPGLQRSHSACSADTIILEESDKESCTNMALTDEDKRVSVSGDSETNF